MSIREFSYWRAYYKEKGRLEAEAASQKPKLGKNQEFRRTMGNNVQPMTPLPTTEPT